VIESVVRGRGRLSEEVIRFHESRHMGLEGLKRHIVSLASSDGNSRDSDVIKQLDSLLMFQTDAVAQKWWKRSAQIPLIRIGLVLINKPRAVAYEGPAVAHCAKGMESAKRGRRRFHAIVRPHRFFGQALTE